MRVVVIGLGVQGEKRIHIAGSDVVATIDPAVPTAQYKQIQDLDLNQFDAALVCTPDQPKIEILRYLLANSKHVLVEKPLLAESAQDLIRLEEIAQSNNAVCYTAYNHRFEPHIVNLKNLLGQNVLGDIYHARIFYGNGTSLDVKNSPWRDNGIGVLSDLGSHVLDISLFLFGERETKFDTWSANRLETICYDHVVFGSEGRPILEFEVTLLSWRNTFTVDVLGKQGSAHIDGLCKWGPSTLTVRKRVYPSGRPEESVQQVTTPDPTWELEYAHFKRMCDMRVSNIKNDLWIKSTLDDLAVSAVEKYTP